LRGQRRLAAAYPHVVPVEGDVDLPERELAAAALLDQPADALRERDASAVDADERDPVEVVVLLDDLVRDAGERPVDRLGIQQDLPSLTGRRRHSQLLSGLAGSALKGSTCEEDCTASRGRPDRPRGGRDLG